MRKALLLGRTNERLVVVCLFSNLPGKRYKKKNKFQGFTNGVKKRKSSRVMRRETKKKEKFPKAKQTCQKFVLPPSFLGERECACVRVCDRDAATTKNPAVADDPKQSSDDE